MTAQETRLQFHKYQQNREKQFTPKFRTALKHQVNEFFTAYNKGESMTNSLMYVSQVPINKVVRACKYDGATIYAAKVAAYLPKLPKKTKSRPTMGFNQRMIDLVDLWFDSEILSTSEGITKTTREEIQRVFKEANLKGEGITWISEQLDELNYNRAKLIARTETVTAANQGGFLAALDTGLMMNKEWLAVNDNRTRLDHVQINGRQVGVTDYFLVGDSTMLYPGDRTQHNGLDTPAKEVCNCRCTCLYKAVRVEGRLVPFDYSQFRQLFT